MKTLFVNRNVIVSIFAIMFLIYGAQGISYGQNIPPVFISYQEIQDKGYKIDVPIITPGETNTSVTVSIITMLRGAPQHAYRVQLRRQSPQGEWITKCIDPNLGKRGLPPWYNGFYWIKAIFDNLEPGITYEARSQDTNLYYECVHNPPNPDPWSEIAEGTTHLVAPPRVEFVDPNLARAVREALKLDTVGGHIELLKIPEAELEKLIHLEYKNSYDTPEQRRVIDLTGLEHATQLTTLSLKENNIRDLTPLAQLTQLTELDLSDNNISDLTPLVQLTQLTELDLSGNNINNLTALAQLTQLTELDLSDNNISDLTPLANFEELDLSGNNITNNWTQLTELDLSGNNINNLTALAQLTQLTELDLSINQITNLTPLTQLTNLNTLFLSLNNIQDIKPIAHLKQLSWLLISHNQIRDVTPLAELTESLTWLGLEGE